MKIKSWVSKAERQKVTTKASFCFILMDVYSDRCSSDQWRHMKIKKLKSHFIIKNVFEGKWM